MKPRRACTLESRNKRKTIGATQARVLLLALICLLVGLALGAYWHHRTAIRNAINNGEAGGSLSTNTRTILKHLNSVIEIHFYSLLDPATTSDELRAFAARVDKLLSEYEHEADGKIKLTRQTTRSDSAAQAASADGIRAFNLDKGDACFLGMAISSKNQKEALGQLSPEWEAALESDLTRAILRVTGAQSVASRAAATAQAEAVAAEEVKRSLPNFASVSVQEGKQLLRDAAMKELKAAMNGVEVQIKEARQRLEQAQSSGSEAELQAALKQLQQLQAQQTEKLKDISARLQEQIAALERLKSQ